MRRIIISAKWGLLVAVATLTAAHLLARTIPLPDRLEHEDSTVVEWRDGRAAHVFLSEDDRWRISVDLSRVDSEYTEALVALEDERFWWHPGVDPIAIVRAAFSNARAGRVVSGASTITMQLVRLLEPRPRTLWSKCVEAARAMQLEMRLSKREILEAYLSYVPYGGNVEGVESASHLYFGKPTESLSSDEITTLLAVPQDPAGRHPKPSNRGVLRSARDRIAAKLVEAGALPRGRGDSRISSERLLEQIRQSPVPRRMGSIPRELPHAARWLRSRNPERRRIRSTLDKSTQQTVERLVDARRPRLQARGIHNAAAVIAEHESGALRALVGNFDFDDHRHDGQIPGFDTYRSTGSLLKPFIYATAIDEGLAAPSHLVPDVPTSFGGYRPTNFNGRYRGLVELEEALSQSLNVPFVELLDEVGLETFLADLRHFGAASFRRATNEYGLSVAVGGMELRPLDVAELYALFARGGRIAQLESRRGPLETGGEGDRGVSRGAAWLTRRALRRRDRPDFPARKSASNVPTGIHWKTGTSAHNRDAWSAGSGTRYTAVVWVGNFDNDRAPALVGSRAAGPLFFDILEALEDRDHAGPEEAPETLTEVEVCAFSGYRPSEACTSTRSVRMPQSSIATQPCPYHVTRDIHTGTGLALTPSCRSEFEYESRSFVQIPARASRWMDQRLGTVPQPPPYKEGCRPVGKGSGPAVEHPPPNRSLVLVPGMDREDQQVPLEAAASNHGATLHWFVDGRFVGSAASDERLWWTPKPGSHEIVVMDESGRSDEREIVVRASH